MSNNKQLQNNKSPGRPKGSPNKATADVRAAIAAFASANVENMGDWLNAIDSPEKKLDLFLRAIEYHIPKLARQDITGEIKHEHNIYSWME